MKPGDKVMKKSEKPFKSGRKTNTIKDFVISPYTGKEACTFEEDDSIVNLEILCYVK